MPPFPPKKVKGLYFIVLSVEVILSRLFRDDEFPVLHASLPGNEIVGHIGEQFEHIVGDRVRYAQKIAEEQQHQVVVDVVGFFSHHGHALVHKGSMMEEAEKLPDF